MEDLEPGLIIDGRYEVRRPLGRGGMSTVYEVEHRYTTRRLALKVLTGPYATSDIARRQLLDEARALGAVRHPYVIEVHDAGFDGSRVYVVTELLEGRSLDGLLAARERLAWPEVARVARHITIALAASHGVGVIHRDVKPSNVMIVRGVQGELSKLLDFGVAALPKGTPTSVPDMLVGTPEYMSPEQLRGDPLDARSDLYSLGITMFECLQGEVPMPGGLDVAHERISLPALPPVADVCEGVPRALAGIIDRLLHPVAAFRFPSARSLLDAFDASGLCKTPTRFLEDSTADLDAGRRTSVEGKPAPSAEADAAARRRTARSYYQTPLRVMVGDGSVIDGRSEDISTQGMLVIAGATPPEGERVVVRFALPMTGTLVQCAAMVGWTRSRASTQGGRAAFGLEFIEPTDAMTDAIERYTELMQRDG